MAYKKKIILVGSGGHAEACIDVIESEKKFKILGLVDIKKNELFDKYKVISNLNDIQNLKKKTKFVHIALGQIKSSKLRTELFKRFLKEGFKFPTIISPTAIISKYAKISDGTIVMHGAHIGPNVKIGRNCIINTFANIEHGSIIGNYCHISTRATINGKVIVGEGSFVGSKSVIRENLKISKNSFIKMGKIIK